MMQNPISVRLRVSETQAITVPACLPPDQPCEVACGPEGHGAGGPDQATATAAVAVPGLPLAGQKPVVALVEAVPAGAVDLACAALALAEAGGCRCAVVSLDRQNRLGARLGCPLAAPAGWWQQGSPDLLVHKGARIVVPGPDREEALDGPHVEGVLERVREQSDLVLVDLGCRWVPRLFRPVLTRATHIWLVARAGQWSAVEMRLEQAEFSGWTDCRRIRLVVIGLEVPVPAALGLEVAAVLPEPGGAAAREFVYRQLGGQNP